jgi:hypothetical protein
MTAVPADTTFIPRLQETMFVDSPPLTLPSVEPQLQPAGIPGCNRVIPDTATGLESLLARLNDAAAAANVRPVWLERPWSFFIPNSTSLVAFHTLVPLAAGTELTIDRGENYRTWRRYWEQCDNLAFLFTGQDCDLPDNYVCLSELWNVERYDNRNCTGGIYWLYGKRLGDKHYYAYSSRHIPVILDEDTIPLTDTSNDDHRMMTPDTCIIVRPQCYYYRRAYLEANVSRVPRPDYERWHKLMALLVEIFPLSEWNAILPELDLEHNFYRDWESGFRREYAEFQRRWIVTHFPAYRETLAQACLDNSRE